MFNQLKSKKPSTPMRQLVINFLKSPVTLGKRSRSRSCSYDDMNLDRLRGSDVHPRRVVLPVPQETPAPGRNMAPPTMTQQSPLPGVALQTEDPESGAIIITSLAVPPFCCHEDLLTMPRTQLIKVAQALNERLPAALQIPVGTDVSDALIRNSIEVLVGIRAPGRDLRAVPPAPKPSRTRSLNRDICVDLDVNFDKDAKEDGILGFNRSPPSSPLAMRMRSPSHDIYNCSSPHRLAMLKEEDEEMGAPRRRPSKRQRVSSNESQGADEIEKAPPRRRSARIRVRNLPSSPTPTPMSDKVCITPPDLHREPLRRQSSPPQTRILRSQSQKMPSERKNIKVDTRFITLTRPKYRFRRHKSESLGKTHNVASYTAAPKDFLNARSRAESVSTIDQEQECTSINEASPKSVRTSVSQYSIGFLERAGLKRDTTKSRPTGMPQDDTKVTSGFKGMTLEGAMSAFDIPSSSP